MNKRTKLKSNPQERQKAVVLILKELLRAEKKHPNFPVDIIHRSAIIAEESGELSQACLDFIYSNDNIEHIKEEAVQVGAMAIRFLISLEKIKEE